ncbi:hypothetical protein BGI41_01595 [Methanobrevibacter sp. 87.7]|uniref:hypothetical protein n=1 Tax=Methanobrevibacter sp. 87.7 TaxID=387957 RepID=UPI000B505BE0|nr:hypothetical protein [Methanobrevibacter sp. 87.7]OWT33605.1 hypothetical protein BGI41_01595 [Methanobrevibacter sp. 87.7]
MSHIECPNCGSTKIVEVDGVPTCLSCGSKLPDLSLGELGNFDKELKEAEITRLYNAKTRKDMEPRMNIFTEDEILKYAPGSKAAEKIRFKRADTFLDKLKSSRDFRIIVTIVAMAFVLFIGTIFSSFGMNNGFFGLVFVLIPVIMYLYFR